MLEFHPETFTEMLRTVPEAIPFCEKPQHSEYLQREVFDRISSGETIDLAAIDLDAFDLGNVTPEWFKRHYASESTGWQEGLNKAFKLVPAAARDKRTFF